MVLNCQLTASTPSLNSTKKTLFKISVLSECPKPKLVLCKKGQASTCNVDYINITPGFPLTWNLVKAGLDLEFQVRIMYVDPSC